MQDKKHPCPDCHFCQWCSDLRCAACLGKGRPRRKKLSISEQIALFEKVNHECSRHENPERQPCCCHKPTSAKEPET